MNAVKEEIKLSPLGTLIYNDGKIDNAIDNAHNFFTNDVSYEIVRASIDILTDTQLKEIYDEVMAQKKQNN